MIKKKNQVSEQNIKQCGGDADMGRMCFPHHNGFFGTLYHPPTSLLTLNYKENRKERKKKLHGTLMCLYICFQI